MPIDQHRKLRRYLPLAILPLLFATPCGATDTLDCGGTPYSVMIHVGHDEYDTDLLADIWLFREGHEEAVQVYSAGELEVPLLRWSGEANGNALVVRSTAADKIPFRLDASDDGSVLRVDGTEFTIRCSWSPR